MALLIGVEKEKIDKFLEEPIDVPHRTLCWKRDLAMRFSRSSIIPHLGINLNEPIVTVCQPIHETKGGSDNPNIIYRVNLISNGFIVPNHEDTLLAISIRDTLDGQPTTIYSIDLRKFGFFTLSSDSPSGVLTFNSPKEHRDYFINSLKLQQSSSSN